MTEFTERKNELGFYEALPKPTTEELTRHYKEKYYQNAQGTYAPEYFPEELKHFHNIAKVSCVTATKLELDRSLLDLGCGEGFFSKSFHAFEWNLLCCDFSEYGISKHNPDLLPFFLSGDIYSAVEKFKHEQRRFGLVNLQNVLEHVLDPIALLNDVKPLLNEKSALRVRVPNDYSDFQLELVRSGHTKNTWFSPPEHLSYFNRQGLNNILEHCGYRILSLQADFPIELFLANPNSNYWKDRSLGKAAHLTRVFCENHLIENDINAYIEYSEAAGKLGFGRDLIAYAGII